MNTVEILAILTALEMIFCHQNYQGYMILLWILYGFFKLATG